MRQYIFYIVNKGGTTKSNSSFKRIEFGFFDIYIGGGKMPESTITRGLFYLRPLQNKNERSFK